MLKFVVYFPLGACSDCNNGRCQLGARPDRDWDYCSAQPGHDDLGRKCRSDHQCGYHGEMYMWCYTEDGNWGKCSLVEESTVQEFTTEGELCDNYCDIGFKILLVIYLFQVFCNNLVTILVF